MPEAVFEPVPGFDAARPSSARMHDYYLSGKDNYAADRWLADRLRHAVPGMRVMARADRAFIARAVATLAREAGIERFVDIGCGLPTRDNVHEIAQRFAPASRVVYVDSDPMVVVHAAALLSGSGGTTAFQADLRAPETILDDPRVRTLLDTGRPVGVVLASILHHLTGDDAPYGAVRRIRDALPPGSHIVISHAERTSALARASALHATADVPLVPRGRDEIARFLDGMRPLWPGLVRVPRWRPDGDGALARRARVPLLGGVARVA